jgi:hypothetical protein
MCYILRRFLFVANLIAIYAASLGIEYVMVTHVVQGACK